MLALSKYGIVSKKIYIASPRFNLHSKNNRNVKKGQMLIVNFMVSFIAGIGKI
jgi:hypothetical protein